MIKLYLLFRTLPTLYFPNFRFEVVFFKSTYVWRGAFLWGEGVLIIGIYFFNK